MSQTAIDDNTRYLSPDNGGRSRVISKTERGGRGRFFSRGLVRFGMDAGN